MVRFPTAAFVLTAAVACGSQPATPRTASGDPRHAPRTGPTSGPDTAPAATAEIPAAREAAPTIAALPAPPLIPITCDAGSAPTPAAFPEPTWYCVRPDGARHGAFVTLFPDRSIEIAGRYRDGALDGPWERRYPGGAIAEQGNYAAGLRDGRWRQLGPTGNLLGEYELRAGTGVERQWYPSGARYTEIAMSDGVRHGAAKMFAPDGALVESARYVRGALDGAHRAGTSRALRIEEQLAHGVRVGARKIWQSTMLLADEHYDRRGRLHGTYALWRTKKIPRVRGQFANGQRTGTWVWTDRDNRRERQGSYVAGKRDGTWTEWWNGKVVFTGRYASGRAEQLTYFDRAGNELGAVALAGGTGTAITFHPNKKPSSKQRLVKGVEDGPYQELTHRGKVVVEGAYRGGRKHGTWKEWTPDGVLVREQSWRDGQLHGAVKKYVDGKISVDATYADGKVHGPYVESRDGRPVVTGQFADDRRTGTWTQLAPDGTVVLQSTYQDGVLDGPWRQQLDGGVLEGQLVAGRRAGTWTFTDRTGAVRTQQYGAP
ncbi:MAG: hypothetical protein ACTHU0_34180 [Kofleriaceae bacterium]